MQIVDLKSREVFGDDGRGISVLVDEPYLKIHQVGLDPGKEVPLHKADASVTIQVLRGTGLFRAGEETTRLGPGKLLRIAEGTAMGILNEETKELVFLVIKTPEGETPRKDEALSGKTGVFVNFVDFAPLKPGREEAFLEWFRRSSEVFAKHSGFISRTLLQPTEKGGRFAALVEHASKETFMDMHLSDDREALFHQVEPLILGASKPHFYETRTSYRRP